MRLFLAIPQDLEAERQVAHQVVAGLNAQSGLPEGDPNHIQVVDWHRTAAPLTTLPESVAFRNLDIQEEDLFVGFSWLGFDDDQRGQSEFSICSEREMELAYSYWKSMRRPRALFLRCLKLPAKLKDIDARKFDRVSLFYNRFDSPEKNRFSYQEFHSVEELEQLFERQIRTLVAEDRPTVPASRSRSQLRGTTQFEKKMEPGKAYEVTFLSFEFADWNGLVKEHEADKGKLQVLAGSLLELVRSTSKVYGGEVFSWTAKGGLMIFWAKRSFDHAIMSGLKVLHNLPVFNLDPQQNPLRQNVGLRVAAHDAVIVFQLPIEEISSSDINFVISLQAENTSPDELSITRRLLDRIDERLRPHFKFKGRYDREPIYSCKLPASEKDTASADLDEHMGLVKRQTSLAMGLLQGPASGLDVSAADSLSTAVDETYSALQRFCHTFSSIDRSWATGFFHQLLVATTSLRREEEALWGLLRQRISEGNMEAGTVRRLKALAQAASRRRARPVVILEKLEERCRVLAAGAEPVATPLQAKEQAEDVIKQIDRLVKADELDSETALTELLMHHKRGFLTFILEHGADTERHQRLTRKLWENADLALLDDLYSIRGHRRADEARIFDALIQPQVGQARFQVVRILLDSETKPEEVVIGHYFERFNLRPAAQDLQVVWRCMVLGHPEESVRSFSALKLSQSSMWQVVSHPSIPIASILAIGERMSKLEGEDAKKIFFDCIRSRVEQAVEGFRSREELNILTKLILQMLGFSFLVETGYFERFDDLLRKFLNRAQSMGMQVEYFEKLRQTLEQARQEHGDKGPAKPPAGIKSLPLTIQRRLAGEARYIYWFVTHPDPRIACETLRHIGLMHVERVLRLREINSTVLLTILRKPELFTRQQAILSALNHPKCTQDFANKYLSTMTRSRQGRQALEKIAQNPSASPVVRSTAKRAIDNAARRGQR